MVRARIYGGVEATWLMFTPDVKHSDIQLADAALEGTGGACTTLVIQNKGSQSVRLKTDMTLGTVVPVEEVQPDSLETNAEEERIYGAADHDGESGMVSDGSQVCTLEVEGHKDDRRQRLLQRLQLQLDHLTPSQRSEMEACIISYVDVFTLDATKLGTTTLAEHTIKTGDQAPIRQPLRRMLFSLRAQVHNLIKEMLSQGVVVPSASPWASPVVLVRKKDGGMRFCVDYRRLNRATKLDELPLPRIDDTLDMLAGARYFTTLDMASGYWQVPMESTSQEKTAFITYSRLYEFKKMPFGLVNAPATFQRLMELVLAGLARDGCHVYLDDVLVFGKTLTEHNCNFSKVLGRIRRAGLKLKPKKCNIARGIPGPCGLSPGGTD